MPRAKYTRECAHCGATFLIDQPSRSTRFCSRACADKRRHLPLEGRFWAKVDRSAGPDGCWPWLAYRNKHGYGRISAAVSTGKHQPERAHRIAYILTYGPIPDRLFVLHGCDNPACVNPAHLHLGTQQDNSAEMAARGRGTSGDRSPLRRHPELAARGERNGQAKLTAADVLTIRAAVASGTPQKDLAAQFGISKALTCLIIGRKVWRHI